MAEQQIYGPLTLPNKTTVTFRKPKGSDKINVTQALRLKTDNISGILLLNQFVAAKCIKEIDGEAVGADYKRTMDRMDAKDFSYYFKVWEEMFNVNDEEEEEAKEQARFLLENSTCIDLSK